MKKFLTKTIFFLLPIFFLMIIMEFLLINTPNDYIFKKKFLDKNADGIETLILGSSHSFYGLNPLYFQNKGFNASHVSQSLKYDYKILMKYQSSFKKLNTIVLPISYFTLYHSLEDKDNKESWRAKNYLIYYGIGESNSILDCSEILSKQLSLNVKKLISYYIEGKSQISCSKFGWGTKHNSEKARNLNKTGKAASERHTYDINADKYQRILKENIMTLNSIIMWCDDRDIKILLITPPAYETYRQNLNRHQLDLIIETTKEICLENKNCSYVNLLYDENFVDSDYFDADHLSEIGAKKLSTLINKTIIE
jgi:hypothetical protein